MINEISVLKIRDAVEKLCIEANKDLPKDIVCKLCDAKVKESNSLAKSVLEEIQLNINMAKSEDLPICQDTGMAVVFLKIGQDVHFIDGSLYDAVNEGVRRGYEKGFLRKSVVSDPLLRENTNDNTPAIIHTEIIDGSSVEITVAPKGFGSENMSGVKMLNPSAEREGVIEAVLEIVKKASNNPCPPIVVGVGIGGDFEECALLSKKALVREGENPNPYYNELEKEILKKINELGIGPQGFGGDTTAIAVNIETMPTHIAGLPVAVNIGCYVNRHKVCEVK